MSKETKARSINGWLGLLLVVAGYAVSIWVFLTWIFGERGPWMGYGRGMGDFFDGPLPLIACVALWIGLSIVTKGFFTIQPNQARVCVLFGDYTGTVREEGLRWANPFYSREHRYKVSTRARTYTGEQIKVNDKMGNPIEIATVIVWHVADTAKACFDVDDYESYVEMITETALRHVASIYSYDHMEDDDESANAITLRTNIEEVSEALKAELDRKLEVAGVEVDDARLTHLAYAPEIAQAMLRRQQAEAIIAARKKIVEGAVSMVDMALSQLSEGGVVEFDDDRKAVMASNLMVVLCGDSEAQPVVNTGTLYQ